MKKSKVKINKLNTVCFKIAAVAAIMLCALIMKGNSSFAANTAQLNVTMNVEDERFDISDEVSCYYDIEIKDEQGNPVNGEFTYSGSENGSIVLNDGVGSLVLHGVNANAVIEGLPEGGSYSVKLNDKTNWYKTETPKVEGVLQSNAQLASFDCEVYTKDIEVLTAISGDYENLDWNLEFALIGLYSSDRPTPKNNIKYHGAKTGEFERDNSIGKIHIKMKDGESIIIEEVPYNPACANMRNNYLNDPDGITTGFKFGQLGEYGDFHDEGEGTAIGTSGSFAEKIVLTRYKYAVSPIIVRKGFQGIGGEVNKEFNMKIIAKYPALSDNSVKQPVQGKYPYTIWEFDNLNDMFRNTNARKVETGVVEFDNNGEANIKIKANQYIKIGYFTSYDMWGGSYIDEDGTKSIQDVEYHKVYEGYGFFNDAEIQVEEINAEGYTNTQYKISAASFLDYLVMNVRKYTGNLTISKKVLGEDADLNKEFKFKIKFEDDAIDLSEYFETLYYEKGSEKKSLILNDENEAEITIKNGESVSIGSDNEQLGGGLPVGMKYIVTEEDYSSEGYITTAENAEGLITEGETKVEFTNTKKAEEKAEEKIEDPQAEDPKVEEAVVEESPQTGDVIIKVCISLVILLIVLNAIIYIVRKKRSK